MEGGSAKELNRRAEEPFLEERARPFPSLKPSAAASRFRIRERTRSQSIVNSCT